MPGDETKCGAKMVAITAGEKMGHADLWQKRIKLPAIQVKTIEETGAGDAFGCGLVAGLVKGWDLERALKLGIANGAAVTEHYGPKQGLLFAPEAEQWLK